VVVDLVRNSVRVSSSIALVLASYGVYGAVWGFSIGYAAATIYAFIRLVKVMDPVLSLAGNDIAEVLNYSILHLHTWAPRHPHWPVLQHINGHLRDECRNG
jgi:hypothetical protein